MLHVKYILIFIIDYYFIIFGIILDDNVQETVVE